MEYHYSDLCMPADHMLTESFGAEYAAPYVVDGDREYELRSSVLVDGGDRFGVSAVVFDRNEELLWMGNQGGHVTSYYGPTMQKYTSFQIHESEEVRHITTIDEGILALTKTTLRHQIRRGLPKHTHRSENMRDMQCLLQLSPNRALLGGHQDKMLDLDLSTMQETSIDVEADGCVVMRGGGGALVACGDAGGTVTLRDVRCPARAALSVRAHSACLSDLDMQGDLLVTCGFAHDEGGSAMAEPYVVVWDVRALRGEGAWSVPLPAPPLLLHFLPAVSGRAVALADTGHATLFHVNVPQHQPHSMFQVETGNSLCSVMDVSATSQALVFGDQAGRLHLFSPQHNTEPVFNNFSRDTEFADPVEGLPMVGYGDLTFQLSSVPRAPLTTGDKWFSDWPDEFFKKVYRKSKPIDPEILKTMKMQGPIGYAPNPRTFRRNQMPYIEDTLQDLQSPKHGDKRLSQQPIPKKYLKVDLRYNKHSAEAEGDACAPSGPPGLDNSSPNSYCNPMLQVLYHTPPVKSALLAHTCTKDFCLSCELGFLFRTLDGSQGAASPSNFLRAFRTAPEAAALGLILPERGADMRAHHAALVQSWNRFILHQVHSEILETRKKEKEMALLAHSTSSPPKAGSRLGNAPLTASKLSSRLVNSQFEEECQYAEAEFRPPIDYQAPEAEFVPDASGRKEEDWRRVNLGQDEGSESAAQALDQQEETEISELFAIARRQLNHCLKCNKEEERDSVVLACALQYPVATDEPHEASFLELLRAALTSRRSTPAWCERCHRFSPTEQHTRVARLPPILAINCGGVSAHEKAYWTKGVVKENPMDALRRGGSSKPCRYGLHCARPGCRFKHPDRTGAGASLGGARAPDGHCVLPRGLSVELVDGDVLLADLQGGGEGETGCAYWLTGVVACIEDNPRHLVAFVRVPRHDQWYLFNDASVVPVGLEEVLEFSASWKAPCVLFYSANSAAPRLEEAHLS